MSSNLTKFSKFLSYVLRHKPGSIGIELDDNGWVDVDTLLMASRVAGQNISEALLREIVETNDKKRFAFDESRKKIRASQGHSVKDVDLALKEIYPPEILYHGTVEKFMEAIQRLGLQKMNRQYVHLSQNRDTAISVGGRRGKPVILEINAVKMHNAGFKFYVSDNGVWLTNSVPWEYIDRESEN